ncbi:hypothetical protein F183_A41560 [Bryobacterales bacterium F-183]|nr:hypothetical protein F183_A41560 [Bryobacterales bacterium F-183]
MGLAAADYNSTFLDPVPYNGVRPMDDALRAKLERARLDLLDLSARNRLLNAPLMAAPKSTRTIRVRDEVASEVYRLLVGDAKAMTFAAAPAKANAAGDDAEGSLPQPDENEALDERGVAARHRDAKLQTSLTSEALQKRLLHLFYDARTFAEEQGVNILFLATGFLKWIDATKTERYAPLVLIPVNLHRNSAASRFQLRWRPEEQPDGNLTLAAKLETEFRVRLPEFPDPEAEGFDLAAYFAAVAEAVRPMAGWEVLPNEMLLGFFSFAKFLMYRDLDSANWPGRGLAGHPLVSGLLEGGVNTQPSRIPDDANLDEYLKAAEVRPVVDMDGSQTLAVYEANRGSNLVIQGPPGTGKSQTIANVIANAVLDGKKVLFLAEKMAALEVVKRRLDSIGLGSICLEMHSNKVEKRLVLGEVGRTMAAGKPTAEPPSPQELAALQQVRDTLNAHCRRLHQPVQPAGMSAYECMGVLAHLRRTRNLPPMDIPLDRADTWTPAERLRRKELIGQIADWIRTHGVPNKHAWYGTSGEPMLRGDADLFLEKLRETEETLSKLPLFGQSNMEEAMEAAAHLRRNAGLPEEADAAVWRDQLAAIGELVQKGLAVSKGREEVEAIFAPKAWDYDVEDVRDELDEQGDGFFNFLSVDFRAAKNQMLSLLRNVSSMPADAKGRVALLDKLIDAQKARREFGTKHEELGRAAFGRLWEGEKSDWPWFEQIHRWASERPGINAWVTTPLRDLDAVRDCHATLKLIGNRLRAPLTTDPIESVRAELQRWVSNPEGMHHWAAYTALEKQAIELGLGGLVDRLMNGRVSADEALDRFAQAFHIALLRIVALTEPDLARFDGQSHNRHVDQFQNLDERYLEANRAAVLHKHYANIPRYTGPGNGAMGVLKEEIAKKRRHLPLRQLVKQAGPALQALKPVFLMSPLSVAQFLEPGAIEFDLLVVDEASQIEPVDALGAMARCRQAVVVGDDRQLPPTRFFSKMTGDGVGTGEEDAETTGVADLDSILGVCRARGFAERMLRWHYRSRHESLIAVSNREFYENRLFLIPSPLRSKGGLRFHHLPNAVYEAGTAVNRVEAKAVAEAVMRHAQASPKLSLGVAAFSVNQRDAILEELEVLRRGNPAAEAFFAEQPDSGEPFFVKNLENVQGDERDVIFISIGRGREADGSLHMRFGPLNLPGGERRLNVLISRAKLRCEVFSSITGQEIDGHRANSRGVAALRTFLIYAQTGLLDGAGVEAAKQTASRVALDVAEVVRGAGYEVTERYGLAGLFLDLAVVDPAHPDRVLMGIEIDGEQYRAAQCARDRDRLRTQVLERQGWQLYRLWTADWYQRPEEQASKLLAALAAAPRVEQEPEPEEPEVLVEQPAEVAAPVAVAADVELGVRYVDAVLQVPPQLELQDAPRAFLIEIVRQVVQAEGPIHEDDVIARVRMAWKLARAGSRVQTIIRQALAAAAPGVEKLAGDFYWIPGSTVQARNRLRPAERIAPMEMDAALLVAAKACVAGSRDQLIQTAARALGSKVVSASMRQALSAQVDELVQKQALTERHGLLSLS